MRWGKTTCRSIGRRSAPAEVVRRSRSSRRCSPGSRPAHPRNALTPRQLAMLGAVSAIWGASYLLIKIALDGFEPMMIVFTRVLLAALLLYAVIQMRGGAERAALRYLGERPLRTLGLGALAVA